MYVNAKVWGWLGGALVPGGLLIWIRVEQGRTALAVSAGRGCFDNFFSSIISPSFLPLSLGDGSI